MSSSAFSYYSLSSPPSFITEFVLFGFVSSVNVAGFSLLYNVSLLLTQKREEESV